MYQIKCKQCGEDLLTLEDYLLEEMRNKSLDDDYSLPVVTHKHLICDNCGHTEKIQIVLDRHIDNYIDEETGKKYPATHTTPKDGGE